MASFRDLDVLREDPLALFHLSAGLFAAKLVESLDAKIHSQLDPSTRATLKTRWLKNIKQIGGIPLSFDSPQCSQLSEEDKRRSEEASSETTRFLTSASSVPAMANTYALSGKPAPAMQRPVLEHRQRKNELFARVINFDESSRGDVRVVPSSSLKANPLNLREALLPVPVLSFPPYGSRVLVASSSDSSLLRRGRVLQCLEDKEASGSANPQRRKRRDVRRRLLVQYYPMGEIEELPWPCERLYMRVAETPAPASLDSTGSLEASTPPHDVNILDLSQPNNVSNRDELLGALQEIDLPWEDLVEDPAADDTASARAAGGSLPSLMELIDEVMGSASDDPDEPEEDTIVEEEADTASIEEVSGIAAGDQSSASKRQRLQRQHQEASAELRVPHFKPGVFSLDLVDVDADKRREIFERLGQEALRHHEFWRLRFTAASVLGPGYLQTTFSPSSSSSPRLESEGGDCVNLFPEEDPRNALKSLPVRIVARIVKLRRLKSSWKFTLENVYVGLGANRAINGDLLIPSCSLELDASMFLPPSRSFR